MHLVLGCHRAKRQADSRTVNIQREKHVCWQRGLLQVWLGFMGSIRFQRIGGTWYPQACRFLKLNHHIHSLWRKALLKGQCSTSRTGQNVLTTIFLAAERRVAISSISKTGSAYLRQCITRKC